MKEAKFSRTEEGKPRQDMCKAITPLFFIMMVPELQRLDKQVQQYEISVFWVERHAFRCFFYH